MELVCTRCHLSAPPAEEMPGHGAIELGLWIGSFAASWALFPFGLVGWGLGGIYARELAKHRPDAVRQVITLGSPFGGERRGYRVGWLHRAVTGEEPSPGARARMNSARFRSSSACFLASSMMVVISSSDRPLEGVTRIFCSRWVARSRAWTLTIPLESMSNDTSI